MPKFDSDENGLSPIIMQTNDKDDVMFMFHVGDHANLTQAYRSCDLLTKMDTTAPEKKGYDPDRYREDADYLHYVEHMNSKPGAVMTYSNPELFKQLMGCEEVPLLTEGYSQVTTERILTFKVPEDKVELLASIIEFNNKYIK